MPGQYLIQINNALFRRSLVKGAKPVFSKAIKHLRILPGEKWVLWGSGKSKLMDILSYKYICDPPDSLEFNKQTTPLIEQVQFKGAIPTAHLSARYEYFKDEFDQTCKQFICDNAIGSNEVNYSVQTTDRVIDLKLYNKIINELRLDHLQDRWAMGLSNGQMRRARLARGLLKKPDLLLIDDPFLGLDPTASSIISRFISNSYEETRIPIVIGLRYQDEIPHWCTHIACVDNINGLLFGGDIAQFNSQINEIKQNCLKEAENTREQKLPNKYTVDDLIACHMMYKKPHHEIIKLPSSIEFKGIDVTYRGEPVLMDLRWDVKAGSKWHIRGDNGSGKSTLLSLIVAEHPQSWNSKVIENGQERRTGKSNYFDINKRIGMSSPELHSIFAKKSGKQLTVRESVATGFHEGSNNNFIAMWEKLTPSQQRIVDIYLEYFGLKERSDETTFGELTVSNQKLVLFVRSLVKMPEILILDEAFSGMEVQPMMLCHQFLERWPGTVLVVAHVEEETPKCDRYIRLLGPGQYEMGIVGEEN